MPRLLLSVLVVGLGCGASSPPPAPPDNVATPGRVEPQAGSSCRAAVAERYPPPEQRHTDPTGRTVVVTETDECGMVVQSIYFEPGSVKFNTDAADGLAGMLSCLDQTEHQRFKLAVIGYTRADERDRDALALARANAIVRYLTECGVPSLGLEARSAPHNAKPDPPRDRRVDFLILTRGK